MRRQPRGTTSKLEEDGDAFYTVYWSRLTKADKYRINGSVPSVSGIYELYYMDSAKKLNLLAFAKTWYGGLRYALRTRTDPDLVEEPRQKQLVADNDCYYRYCEVGSTLDMDDLLFYFEQVHLPNRSAQRHSGRYLRIHVRELSDDKIVTI